MNKFQPSRLPEFNSTKDELLYIKSRLQDLEKDKQQLLRRQQTLENHTNEVILTNTQLGKDQKITF